MALDLYNKKRNFSKTPEPKGKVLKSKGKNLYIIQKHAASHLHYDFRLELNGVLLSWAVPKGPCYDHDVKRLAMQTEDHPIEYGSFEGIIPKGEYGGGTVMLWDKGEWICEDPDPKAAYKKGHLRFTLNGKKLKGRWSLIKLRKGEDNSWFLIKGKDDYVKKFAKYDVTIDLPNSVISDLSLDEIAENYSRVWTKSGEKTVKSRSSVKAPKILKNLTKTKFPTLMQPMLATLVSTPPDGTNWLHEIKFDGYRMFALIQNPQDIKLISRNNNDWTDAFPNVLTPLKKLARKTMILDGEVVLLDKNSKSDFQLLQNSIDDKQSHPFIYYIFDLLYYDGFDLRNLSLLERKEILQNILSTNQSDTLRFSDHVVGQGQTIFAKAEELGLEGIICKEANSSYIGKRSKSWLKVKCMKRQELLIGGYTKPKASRGYFGSLFLGYYNKSGQLIFSGNVGTGFTQASLKRVYDLLQKNRSDTNPFSSNPPGYKNALWVKPKLIAEIEFTEWTQEGSLRHPSFKGLRTDKKPKQIIREVEVTPPQENKKSKKQFSKYKNKAPAISISNPDKILYAEDKITKLQLAEYYVAVADKILPFIKNRPLTLVRCPEGYNKCFYQKHLNETSSAGLYEINTKTKKDPENSIYLKDKAGLIALAQMGCLEVHPWGSRIETVEYPDTITFDLDPAPEVKWRKVVETAFLLKKHLENFKLKSFVKTTGGKGLHVVVPILPEYTWAEVKNFAHVFVDFMVQQYPKDYISEMSKAKRKNKIFLDYLRNQRGATAVAAYSTRARIHAPISTPIDWKELTDNFEDTAFYLHNIIARLDKLKKDPWEKYFTIKQSLHLDKL